MARNNFKILDSDMHLMEPVDLWERYIDSKFKSAAPRGPDQRECPRPQNGPSRWPALGPPANPWKTELNQGHNFRKNQGIYSSNAERGWTATVQLEAMDIEGIDVAVLYPTRGLQVLAEPNMEPEFAAALASAYNNWLYDFCEGSQSSALGAGMISPFDIDEAVAETKRCVKELGFRAIFMRSNITNGRSWHDDYYEPLWSLLEELRFHLDSTSILVDRRQTDRR